MAIAPNSPESPRNPRAGATRQVTAASAPHLFIPPSLLVASGLTPHHRPSSSRHRPVPPPESPSLSWRLGVSNRSQRLATGGLLEPSDLPASKP